MGKRTLVLYTNTQRLQTGAVDNGKGPHFTQYTPHREVLIKNCATMQEEPALLGANSPKIPKGFACGTRSMFVRFKQTDQHEPLRRPQ